MKDIKDYLHLYLGCEIEMSRDEYTLPHPVKLDTQLLNEARYNVIMVKPILRPLSDMTEEETRHLMRLSYTNYRFERDEAVKKERQSGFISLVNDNGMTCYHSLEDFNPESFVWLLLKGFDLFNLIPEGLAIDKTTLSNSMAKDQS